MDGPHTDTGGRARCQRLRIPVTCDNTRTSNLFFGIRELVIPILCNRNHGSRPRLAKGAMRVLANTLGGFSRGKLLGF